MKSEAATPHWQVIESRVLAPYAMRSRASRGRRHPEPEHPLRSPYQRDRDRIIHATAFRRLEYKTQVFVVHEGDYYRTRLTHTIEVSQIARSISRSLALNEDLTEAVSLAHDLGHTPFGHSGEATLHDLMRDYGGYEHNRQGLRVVDRLERRYPDFDGLNLTFEVREGIIKHNSEYDDPEKRETEEFEPDLAPTLEAQVVNLADEIAYNSHDLDDGLKSGLLNESALRQLDIWRRLNRTGTGGRGRLESELHRYQAIRNLINLLATDLIEETRRRLDAENIDSPAAVRRSPTLVAFSRPTERQHAQLKAFLMANMYRHYRVIRMSEKARRIIRSLFETYLQQPEQMPPDVYGKIRRGEKTALVVCDYIAGMTDNFALEEYRKLFDPLTRV